MGYRGMDERELAQARKREIREQRFKQLDKERYQYLNEWTENQVVFWIERMNRLRVNKTGNLQSSMESSLLLDGTKAMIAFRFLKYGKYQDDGTGREFTNEGYIDSLGRHFGPSRQADGTLPFLLPGGEEYREKHKLNDKKKVGPAWGGKLAGGHPRQAKPWYFKKYYAGRMVLNELEMKHFATSYLGMMTYALDLSFGTVRVL